MVYLLADIICHLSKNKDYHLNNIHIYVYSLPCLSFVKFKIRASPFCVLDFWYTAFSFRFAAKQRDLDLKFVKILKSLDSIHTLFIFDENILCQTLLLRKGLLKIKPETFSRDHFSRK